MMKIPKFELLKLSYFLLLFCIITNITRRSIISEKALSPHGFESRCLIKMRICTLGLKTMKAIQIIDGADNCLYETYLAEDNEFNRLFPNEMDIQFIEDIVARLGDDETSEILFRLWARPINKKQVKGIYGTIFYEQYYKNVYFPTRKEAEMTIMPFLNND